MSTNTARRTRPTVVTIASAIWCAVVLVRLGFLVVAVLNTDGELAVALVGAFIGLAFAALFVWLAIRMARGSGSARLWLAIVAGFAVVNTVVGLVLGAGAVGFLYPIALVAATVLSYLPSTRGFFPKTERRVRPAEPRTVGWDPATGERITEPAPTDGRAG